MEETNLEIFLQNVLYLCMEHYSCCQSVISRNDNPMTNKISELMNTGRPGWYKAKHQLNYLILHRVEQIKPLYNI